MDLGNFSMKCLVATVASAAAVLLVTWAPTLALGASDLKQGPEKCKKCHKAEHAVWTGSPHGKSFREIHKKDKAKTIAEKVGGGKMRKNALCQQCHYSIIDKRGRPKADAGPSCESCHGNATSWIEVHNNEKRPKADRRRETVPMGMIWSDMQYDIVENCFGCHSLSKLPGEKIDALLSAGHPINGDYEVVRYSQGSVRHRFYPPNVSVNAEMNPAELAGFYTIGQLVSLVDATEARKKSDHPAYRKALAQRIDRATQALSTLSATKGLLSGPTESKARKAVNDLAGQDLSAAIGRFLPASSSYK